MQPQKGPALLHPPEGGISFRRKEKPALTRTTIRRTRTTPASRKTYIYRRVLSQKAGGTSPYQTPLKADLRQLFLPENYFRHKAPSQKDRGVTPNQSPPRTHPDPIPPTRELHPMQQPTTKDGKGNRSDRTPAKKSQEPPMLKRKLHLSKEPTLDEE